MFLKSLKRIILFSIFLVGFQSFSQEIAETPIPVGHSHNDYTRKRPLFDALENGFCSIEIDVFAHENQLIVSHYRNGLKRKPNIEELYLNPLNDLLKNQQWIYNNYKEPLILMIDFKTNATKTLTLLNTVVKPFKHLFVHWNESGELTKAPLKIVISGNKPIEEVLKMNESMFFIDGSVSECEETQKPWIYARGSAHYKSQFSWNGKGDMSKEELKKLETHIQKALSCNKKIRYWAMPENEMVWKLFLDNGVQWINVDNLKRFKAFYLDYKHK